MISILSMAIPSGDPGDGALAILQSRGGEFTAAEPDTLIEELAADSNVFTTPLKFLPVVLFLGISLAYLGSIIPGLAVGSMRLDDANNSDGIN